MTGKILLKLSPKHKPIPITPQAHPAGKYGYVVLGPVQIGGQAGPLADLLRRLADQLEPTIQHTDFDRVLSITPAEVVAHFENSPILQSMAPDVRAVLLNGSQKQIEAAESQLQRDLEQVFGAGLDSTALLADISEVLTGERQYGGATYKRVKDVAEALKTSTTTAKSGRSSPKQAKRAA